MNIDYLQETFGLPGRTALITGSGSGLGHAIAACLGQAGARVVINDLDLPRCEAAVQELLHRAKQFGLVKEPAGSLFVSAEG